MGNTHCCDFKRVILVSKELETFLEKELGATGKGLHEKISSVEHKLPHHCIANMRYLATIRNKIVHNANYNKIDDLHAFNKKFKESKVELGKLCKKDQASCLIM